MPNYCQQRILKLCSQQHLLGEQQKRGYCVNKIHIKLSHNNGVGPWQILDIAKWCSCNDAALNIRPQKLLSIDNSHLKNYRLNIRQVKKEFSCPKHANCLSSDGIWIWTEYSPNQS